MKMNFTSPIWLQSASNIGGKKPVTRFVFVKGQNQVQLSAEGDVIIESVQSGEKVLETYSALDDTHVTINADEGTEIVIYGAVYAINNAGEENLFTSLDVSMNTALTNLYCNGCTGLTTLDVSMNTALTRLICNDCTGLTTLDVSKNTALTNLYCNGCSGLTTLDVSKNTALTILYCNGCTGLTTVNGIAVNSEVSTSIAGAITNATSVDGTVTLRQGDEFNQTIIDDAMEKGWDVQYYQ